VDVAVDVTANWSAEIIPVANELDAWLTNFWRVLHGAEGFDIVALEVLFWLDQK